MLVPDDRHQWWEDWTASREAEEAENFVGQEFFRRWGLAKTAWKGFLFKSINVVACTFGNNGEKYDLQAYGDTTLGEIKDYWKSKTSSHQSPEATGTLACLNIHIGNPSINAEGNVPWKHWMRSSRKNNDVPLMQIIIKYLTARQVSLHIILEDQAPRNERAASCREEEIRFRQEDILEIYFNDLNKCTCHLETYEHFYKEKFDFIPVGAGLGKTTCDGCWMRLIQSFE